MERRETHVSMAAALRRPGSALVGTKEKGLHVYLLHISRPVSNYERGQANLCSFECGSLA
jgi:hypothetical protein